MFDVLRGALFELRKPIPNREGVLRFLIRGNLSGMGCKSAGRRLVFRFGFLHDGIFVADQRLRMQLEGFAHKFGDSVTCQYCVFR